MASAYGNAGVDIDAGERFVQMIKKLVGDAWPQAEQEIGGFAGTFKFDGPQTIGSAGSDGAGTVAILGALAKRPKVIGLNAAAMSVVDVYAAGYLPVALLDVLDVAKLDPEQHIGVIEGLIDGCKMAGPQCRLIGGETAEMPDVFAHEWIFNVNTTVIGQPMEGLITKKVSAGQIVMGWPSYGFGSNGFSLIRKVYGLKQDPDETLRRLNECWSELGGPLVDSLLVPAPIWITEIEKQRAAGIKFAAHAHITGGGLVDNIPRILPGNLKVVIDRNNIERPPIFGITQWVGNIDSKEMDRVFNQGVMLVSIVDNDGKSPKYQYGKIIGEVEERKGDEPQVQFIGEFAR